MLLFVTGIQRRSHGRGIGSVATGKKKPRILTLEMPVNHPPNVPRFGSRRIWIVSLLRLISVPRRPPVIARGHTSYILREGGDEERAVDESFLPSCLNALCHRSEDGCRLDFAKAQSSQA